MRLLVAFGAMLLLAGCAYFLSPERLDARLAAEHPVGSPVAALERRLAKDGFRATGGDWRDPEAWPACMEGPPRYGILVVAWLEVCYRSDPSGQIEELRVVERGASA